MQIRNLKIYAATSMVGFIMALLGKGAIVACTTWVCFLIAQNIPAVENPILPAVFSALISYLVASLYLSIFDFSALAIL